jgi:hypothetical protein
VAELPDQPIPHGKQPCIALMSRWLLHGCPCPRPVRGHATRGNRCTRSTWSASA